MVSVLHWGTISEIHLKIGKIWWWGIITNGLKSPSDLYLEAKNESMSRYAGYVYNIALSYNL